MTRLLPLLLLTALLAGCGHYEFGSLAHPDLAALHIGKISNETSDPRLGPYLSQSLPTAFAQDGSVSLTAPGEATARLEARVIDFALTGVGEVPSEVLDKDQDSYRTSVYDIRVKVAYKLIRPSNNTAILGEQIVEGQARFSELGDLDAVMTEGAQRAVTDAAKQVVRGITEAW